MNALPARSPEAQRARLTARDYWLLADAGAFVDYAKAELIEGEIWVVNSVWVWHARMTAHFSAELTVALRELASPLVVYGSGSVNVAEHSVPEPDVSVGANQLDGRGLPLEAVHLAVEISDSTLARDLGAKARLYGTAGIPEYWVIDRDGGRVVQMWAPGPDGYTKRRETPLGDRLTAETLPGITIATLRL